MEKDVFFVEMDELKASISVKGAEMILYCLLLF